MAVIFDAEKLRTERTKQKLTQSDLAELAGTSERYERALETGTKTNPSAAVVFRLSEALNITMNDLMITGEGED